MIKINDFIISAFVTINTPYESILSQYLLPSLEKFNLPHYIEAIDNQGSWLKNVAQKPKTILNAMEKFPAYNIVAIDVDAEILQFPQLFLEIPEEYDFACHILSWKEWYHHEVDTKETLSGTVFIRNNDKMKELVTRWLTLATSSNEWEQKCLFKALQELNIKVFELPLSYCYIKTLPDGREPFIKLDNIVIKHYNLSRQYKRKIHL